MSIFTPEFIIMIIEKYFNKYPIKNFKNYSKEYYSFLSQILNHIYDNEYYIRQSNIFLNLSPEINFNNLLEDYPILLEHQPIILLLYKILEQTNYVDPLLCVNDLSLVHEILNNNNFTFLVEVTKDINTNILFNKIDSDLSKFYLN